MYQCMDFIDGSVAERDGPCDKWIVSHGNATSKAGKFAEKQNKHWKPWMKDSTSHADDDDRHARRKKK